MLSLNVQNAANLRLYDASIVERLQQHINALNAGLLVLIKMASVIITLKIMPESPETNLNEVTEKAKKLIGQFCDESEFKTEEEPVAFGLKAMKITFVMDEEKGSTDALEEQIKEVNGVQSVEVTDVRRTIG
jgi:elongation factor 1-beta|tara:strand:+ start:66 stop:461 length:396 start_codon:yes stop_codon:yes gene_type:complete